MKVRIEIAAVFEKERRKLGSFDLEIAAVPAVANVELLTPRENEIYKLLKTGKVTKEIAVALNISVRTVKYHLRSIYKRMGCGGIRDLLALTSTSGRD